MQAVIMAAGQSTRTYPLTLTRPKPLLKIANKTILDRQLDALSGLVDEVILIVAYRKEMIEAHFGAQRNGIAIKYVHQTEQLGTGHAVMMCRPQLAEHRGPVVIVAGDSPMLQSGSVAAVLAEFLAQRLPQDLLRFARGVGGEGGLGRHR